MTDADHPTPAPRQQPTIRRTPERTAPRADPAVTLLALLAPVMLLYGITTAGSGSVDAPPAPTVETIDPNTATWPELATLPRLGEVKAKAIVAYRESVEAARTDASESGPVFRRPADLDAVRGIGPKTIERLTPFLCFDKPLRGA